DDRTNNRTFIVEQVCVVGARIGRWNRIHGEVDDVGLLTDVAGLVDHLIVQAVRAIGQRRGRREFPFAIAVGLRAADFLAVVMDDDGGIRLGGALVGRRVVVGGAAADDRANNRTFIV